ncbi:MAG: fused MFS/spermidine synthase [Micropepsaceae bacterium]
MGDIASPKQLSGKLISDAALDQLIQYAYPLVTAAIFSAATLLFWVQPMFGKLVLPLLGGTPAVWTTALLFFQTALLLGYLYAHLLGQYLPLKAQIIVHTMVLLLAAFCLPIGVPANTMPPSGGMPALWLIGLFAVTVGAPYTAIAATSPLLQRWFSLSSHAAAANPYRLYAASNAGSLIGLLGYPLLVEPVAGAALQSVLWSTGFLALTALIAITGTCLQLIGTGNSTSFARSAAASWFDRFRWVALAFVPSSLLLGVTTHITTDIAAMPLLWAVPLALYLVTFIVAFTPQAMIPRHVLLKAEALSLVILAAMMWFDGSNSAGLAISLAGFFVIALARHSELASTKPQAGQLTEFYLWLSAGGALGGIFNAVVAPELFSRITEYPLTLVAAGFTRLLLVPADRRKSLHITDFVLLVIAIAGAMTLRATHTNADDIPLPVVVVAIAALALSVYHFQASAWRFSFGLCAMLVLLHARSDSNTIIEARSFFGAYRVYNAQDAKFVILSHGTTIHGAQSTIQVRPSPLTYYVAEGPLGQAISAMRTAKLSLRYGVVGMGAGASACHSRPSDLWTFFEIDPLVVRLAKEQGSFRYMKECAPAARIVVGDARLSLTKEANSAFDVIIMDAFSSDSIPTHLMTREALSLLRTKLAPGGVILFNISNRYLRLEPVVANTARAAGLLGISQVYLASELQQKKLVTSSQWIALSDSAGALERVAETGNWHPLHPDVRSTVWTDDYSSLLGVLAIR